MLAIVLISVMVALVVVALIALVLNVRRINRSDRFVYHGDTLALPSEWIDTPDGMTASSLVAFQDGRAPAQIARTAEHALRNVGVHRLQVTESDVQGWIQLSVVPLQVGVKFRSESNGGTLFTVSARPRYSSTTFAYGQNRRIVNLAAKAVTDEWEKSTAPPA